ncbi:hypothetical protein TNCV_1273571 [Trichonephila clavipes]|nr:hypothetical protein TNCV_1273571 [Trichonephila clavipes]
MMGMRLHLPENIDNLARQLEKIWQEIPQETIRVLYHSMPRRVAACIKNTANLNGFSKAATPNVSKVEIRTHSFPRTVIDVAVQGLYCTSTDTNRQPKLFPIDFNPKHALRNAEDRNASSGACEKTTHFCLKMQNFACSGVGKEDTGHLRIGNG